MQPHKYPITQAMRPDSAIRPEHAASTDLPIWIASPDMAEGLIRDLFKTVRQVHLKIKGTCMSPAMPAGVRVAVSPAHLKPPRMGDAVLIRLPYGFKLHRVYWGPPLAPAGSCWRTRGDRSIGWDPCLQAGTLLGTVVSFPDSPGEPVRLAVWQFFFNAAIVFLKTVRFRIGKLVKPLQKTKRNQNHVKR